MFNEIIDIVKEAAGIMAATDFSISSKDGVENIVTSSDLAVQNFLIDKFSKLLPGSRFLCEEGDLGRTESFAEWEWIIDPIDGTANYARGIADCGISVALCHNGTLEYGVFYSPGRAQLFSAKRGYGAFCNGRPIHVSARGMKEGILCTAASTYAKQYAGTCFSIIADIYAKSNDLRRFGSAALELCLLAKGEIELYFEYRLQPWDYAAATLILHEAGGYICGFDGGLPSLQEPSMVAAANCKGNLDEVLGIIHSHMSSWPD